MADASDIPNGTPNDSDTPSDVDLTEDDFAAIGGGVSLSDTKLVFEEDERSLRITAPKRLQRGLGCFVIAMGLFCAMFWFVLDHTNNEHAGLYKLLITLHCMATAAGVIFLKVRQHRRVRALCPLVEIDRGSGRVSILAGRETFDASDVVCLLAFTRCIPGGQENSWCKELRILVETEAERRRICLAVEPREHWAVALRPLAAVCDIPILMGEEVGMIKGTEAKLKRL